MNKSSALNMYHVIPTEQGANDLFYKKVKTENEIVKNYTKKINEKITQQKATIEKEKEFIPIKNFADFKYQLKQAVKKDKAHIKKVKNELNNNQWTIKTLNNQLMDDKIHNYKDYQKYTKKNTESNFPKELFRTFPKFDFFDTYEKNKCPFYSREECIKAIKKYLNLFIYEDFEDDNEKIKILHEKDKKIPNEYFPYFYGGNKKDFLIF